MQISPSAYKGVLSFFPRMWVGFYNICAHHSPIQTRISHTDMFSLTQCNSFPALLYILGPSPPTVSNFAFEVISNPQTGIKRWGTIIISTKSPSQLFYLTFCLQSQSMSHALMLQNIDRSVAKRAQKMSDPNSNKTLQLTVNVMLSFFRSLS